MVCLIGLLSSCPDSQSLDNSRVLTLTERLRLTVEGSPASNSRLDTSGRTALFFQNVSRPPPRGHRLGQSPVAARFSGGFVTGNTRCTKALLTNLVYFIRPAHGKNRMAIMVPSRGIAESCPHLARVFFSLPAWVGVGFAPASLWGCLGGGGTLRRRPCSRDAGLMGGGRILNKAFPPPNSSFQLFWQALRRGA